MTPPEQSASHFAHQLGALAELCVVRGVNLQRQQELIVSAPLEASALVHQIACCSYARGAKSVTCLYEDPVLIRDHLTESEIQSLDYAPEWMFRGVVEGMRSGAARLRLVGPYPDLLSDVPIDRIAQAHRARLPQMREEEKMFAQSKINWCVLPVVTTSWAKQVFSHLPEEVAQDRLWDAVFDVTRIADDDPMREWDAHLNALDSRREALQERAFRFLRFFDGKTDLKVELAEGHRWVGGTAVAANGVHGIHNIPTEEIFTSLGGNGVHGQVFFSRPLALGGKVVEKLYAEFDHGKLTKLRADRGLEVFEQLIANDERSRRLGEIGLVPASSRVGRTEIAFWNPLMDRNAASHVAFGESPHAGPHPLDEERAHESAVRIDCILGHAAMHIDGITGAGQALPVMRHGEFVEF